ncbi:tRNA-splicing endonuclease subunit Sen54-like [Patiria miniata]|uniref:tRNA-splicing endonuclease subunit Sen54 N-terminal domain-containing protein n=1 Tax=Patiria miniata TaxID=46514 RepID=A0A914AL69_PATMI|nr:tRNA-splicing endonuclease subunit Sen54-like [Patiria miniata]
MAETLRTEELMNYRRLDSSLPRRGPKEKSPDGSQRQEQKLRSLHEQQITLLKERRVAKLSNLAIGEWSPCKELVEVKVEKGKFWQTMGYHSGGRKYLYAEEGLFLLEMNGMELRHRGVPLTMQEAYELMIPEQFSLEHYQVYSHLMRLGYITTRHKENDITDYEYRIRLHQYRHNQKKVYRKVQGWFQQMDDDTKTDMQEEVIDRYGDTSAHTSIPEGQQTSNDMSNSSFAGVSSRASNDQAVTGDAMNSGGFPPLPGSETSSSINNLPSEASSLYSDSPVMVRPVRQEGFGASINLLNYHKMFLQASDNVADDSVKRSLPSSTSYTESDEKGKEEEDLEHSKKRRKLDLDNELIVYSDSGRDSSVKTNQALYRLPSSEDSPTKYNPLKEYPLNFQIKKEDFDKLLRPSNTPWESSDLGTSHPSCTPSVNIDDVLDTFLPTFNDRSDSDSMSCPYSSWNFQTIKLPNLADGKWSENYSAFFKDCKSKEIPASKDKKSDMSDENAEQLMKASQELLKTSAKMIATSGKMMANSGKTASSLEDRAGFMKKKLPTNWGEYKKLLMLGVEEDSQDLLECPTAHLWQGDVKPLVHPSEATYTGNLLSKLQVISSANVSSEHVRLSPPLGSSIKLAFDVFLSSPTHKKTQPGRPKFHVVVARVTDAVPDLFTLANLLQQASAITLLVAVVDNGDITFYTLKGIELSTDISLG